MRLEYLWWHLGVAISSLTACSASPEPRPAPADAGDAWVGADTRDDATLDINRVGGTALFPNQTLTDWVSYADQLSVVQVIEEAVIAPPPEVEMNGEGYIGRRITLLVERTLWLNEGVEARSGSFQISALGWLQRQGGRRDVALPAGFPRLELLGRYVIPLLRFQGGVAPLTPDSVFAAPGDVVAESDLSSNGTGTVAAMLDALSLDEVSTRMLAAPRDPKVEPYLNLEPEARLRAATQTNGP